MAVLSVVDAAGNLFSNTLYMTYDDIISVFPQEANVFGEMQQEVIRARGVGFVETISADIDNEGRVEMAYIGAL